MQSSCRRAGCFTRPGDNTVIDLQEWAAQQGVSSVMYPVGSDMSDGCLALDRWFVHLLAQSKPVPVGVRKAKSLIDILVVKEQWRETLERISNPHMLAVAFLTSTMPGWPSDAGLEILDKWLGVEHWNMQPHNILPLYVDAMFGEHFRMFSKAMLPTGYGNGDWAGTFKAIMSLRPDFLPGVLRTAGAPQVVLADLPELGFAP
jgi:hypothetical protein